MIEHLLTLPMMLPRLHTMTVLIVWNNRMTRNVSLPVHYSAMLPDEAESSLMDTLGVAETSDVATTRYSKCPSDKIKFSHFSFV